MSSILKVDTIQDQSGNNIINESGNVITIGASGDTITVPAGATLSGDLNASNLTSGTVPSARVSGTYTGITQVGTLTGLTTTGNINLGDSDVINLGASNDLQIFHSNSGSFIKDAGTSNLFIDTDGNAIELTSGNTAESMGRFVKDGAVELYYDNSKKFETTSTGATVTGTLTTGAITSTGNLTVTGDATITKNDTPLYLNRTGSDGEVLRFSKDGTQVGQAAVKSSNLYISSNSSNNTGFKINPNAITPAASNGTDRDNAIDLGASSSRYKDIYLSGGAFIGGTGTSNKLDDYEEGTFTPVLEFGNATTGITYNNRDGMYVKVGELVMIQIFIELSNKGSASGDATISGLPFTMRTLSSGWSGVGAGSMTWTNFASRLYSILTNPNRNTQELGISGVSNSSGELSAQALNSGDFNNNTYFGITVSYRTT